jgi:hypothetical protein
MGGKGSAATFLTSGGTTRSNAGCSTRAVSSTACTCDDSSTTAAVATYPELAAATPAAISSEHVRARSHRQTRTSGCACVTK